MSTPIFILLGSNIGNELDNLTQARLEISRSVGTIITTSSIYKTAAWGNQTQSDFYNQVVEINSTMTPNEFLAAILEIERKMGRVRKEKWGPRIIDIDVLFWGDLIMLSENLTIPHPGIPERKFTLLPLSELANDFIHPVTNKSVGQMLIECKDDLLAEKLD